MRIPGLSNLRVGLENYNTIPATVKGVCEVLGTTHRPYPIQAVISELIELTEAATPEERAEELDDVIWTLQGYLYGQKLIEGDMPALGHSSIKKYFKRLQYITDVLKSFGVTVVNKDSFANGTNWKKPAKVEAVLKFHNVKYTPEDLQRIADGYVP